MASLDRLPLGGFDLLCARRGDRFRLTLGRSEGWVSQGAVAAAERCKAWGIRLLSPSAVKRGSAKLLANTAVAARRGIT